MAGRPQGVIAGRKAGCWKKKLLREGERHRGGRQIWGPIINGHGLRVEIFGGDSSNVVVGGGTMFKKSDRYGYLYQKKERSAKGGAGGGIGWRYIIYSGEEGN